MESVPLLLAAEQLHAVEAIGPLSFPLKRHSDPGSTKPQMLAHVERDRDDVGMLHALGSIKASMQSTCQGSYLTRQRARDCRVLARSKQGEAEQDLRRLRPDLSFKTRQSDRLTD